MEKDIHIDIKRGDNMPEEKRCGTCLYFGFEGMDKNCSEGHVLIKNNFQQEGLNCPDWEHRSEPKRMPNNKGDKS